MRQKFKIVYIYSKIFKKTSTRKIFFIFLTNYLERAACFLIAGCPPPDLHLNQDVLNEGVLWVKGFVFGIPTKGFFSCNGLSFGGFTGFFGNSEVSAMMMFFTDKIFKEIYEYYVYMKSHKYINLYIYSLELSSNHLYSFCSS